MRPEWTFADTNDYGYIKVAEGTGSITKINDFAWRWEAHKSDEVIIDMDGWWGISKTADAAIKEVEHKLNVVVLNERNNW